MKLSYDVFIRHEVYRTLQDASDRDQERALDFIESLAGDPFREGEATIPDEHGRAVQVKMLGRLVFFIGPITQPRKFESSISPSPKGDRTSGCTSPALSDYPGRSRLSRNFPGQPATYQALTRRLAVRRVRGAFASSYRPSPGISSR